MGTSNISTFYIEKQHGLIRPLQGICAGSLRNQLGQRAFVALLMVLVGLIVLAGCGSSGPPEATRAPSGNNGPGINAAPFTDSGPSGIVNNSGAQPYLLLNQHIIEGFSSNLIDLEDADSVFWHIFSRLPDQVTIYPSENYYYFILDIDGRELWGNIRLAAGLREQGILAFGYFEFNQFPTRPPTGLRRFKYYTEADGLRIEEIDRFTYVVQYNAKSVTFNLHQLPQEPPNPIALGEDEVFVERTFDESGYQFFLLFNERSNYFLWVLNEEQGVPDLLKPVEEDLLVGKRSGFAFWIDAAHGDRKILAAVRRINISRNNYFDGPFDQLADNYADEARISEYMQRASPTLRGRIDKYGYYTDRERPLRVALSNYYTYLSTSDLRRFMEQVREIAEPYQYISRKGIPVSPESTPSPADPAE